MRNLSLVPSFCVKYKNYSRTRNMSMLDSEERFCFTGILLFFVKFLSHKLIVSQRITFYQHYNYLFVS
jgi:hypothetical protein